MNAHRCLSVSILAVVTAAAMMFPSRCTAQENANPDSPEANADVTGCADLPEFPRLPSSKIVSCDKGNSIEVTMPLKPDSRGYAQEKTVRGEYEFREYQIVQTELRDQAFNALQQILPIKGFDVKFSSPPSTITGHKQGAWLLVSINGESYDVKLVRVNEDAWTAVKNAAEISKEMETHHRVAIYGIHFSSDDQIVIDGSSPILTELLKYLQQTTQSIFFVESHTFSANGTAERDQQITNGRAEAVVKWLGARGIPAARLRPRGAGRSKPLSDTDTPSENQWNDRIELATAN